MNALVQLRRSAQRQRPKKSYAKESSDNGAVAPAASHRMRASVRPASPATSFLAVTPAMASSCPLSTGNTLILFLLIFRPKMKRVGENDVTHDPFRMIIREVDRRVELKIRCDVPGKTDGG
jgi:hypothetical protein